MAEKRGTRSTKIIIKQFPFILKSLKNNKKNSFEDFKKRDKKNNPPLFKKNKRYKRGQKLLN